ncbi:NRAMP family divalent metal transporter [Pseudosporangium ferrugineum]|uniref:Mn2+/Fe2+ NRAMP family transporter n=1 Tax=Pseudosporangium ferrugineum TaxID=439699 RepID=A0A2T0RU58_9ACTN|nr:NRAMP family divalent metal transporter [Pseudosporangium ferrugineum]PRY24736.1 Mn2+/Fe2+ NRAMP family transporter [Pseudosporangium ferrugineum]
MPTDTTARSRTRRTALIGAIFLMATSAIGPGFITQTTTFTAKLGAAFAFGILVSILVDFVVQMNIWRIISVSGKRAHEIANAVVPGAGHLLAALVILGGLVFNIGNVAGSGLGLNAALGLDPKLGGLLSALLAVIIFAVKRAGLAMDRLIIVLGVVMILLTLYVSIVSGPPVGEALRQTVLPDDIDFAAITTIIGGTVGGYITYSGAHRLLDSGTTGPEHVREVTRGALTGIAVTGLMRFLLFLAILGVVAGGVVLDTSGNATAQAFESAAGEFGRRAFGVVLWAAAITSVVGAAFTSVSFFNAYSPALASGRPRSWATVAFIAVSTAIYLLIGTAPSALLVFAGGFNGLILPIGFTILLYAAWRRRELLRGYAYPGWLLALGAVVAALTWYMGVTSARTIFDYLAG